MVSLIWGSTFFLIKDTVASVNENLIVFTRSSLAFFAMLLYVLFKNPKLLVHKTGITYGLILGVLLALTYTSQTVGLKFTSTGHSAFITSSAVVAVPFVLFTFYRVKPLAIDLIAVSIVFAGLFLLTYDFETAVNRGDLITLITALSAGFHIVMSGRSMIKAEALTVVTYQFLGASLVSLLAWLASGNIMLHMSNQSLGALIYLGFVGTLFCYFVSVWIQKYVSSIKVAVIFSLEPVFAAIFGFVFIGEVFSLKELFGAVLILAGVLVHSITYPEKK